MGTHHSPCSFEPQQAYLIHHAWPFTRLHNEEYKIKIKNTQTIHIATPPWYQTWQIQHISAFDKRCFRTPAMQPDSHSKHTQEMQTHTHTQIKHQQWRGQHSIFRETHWDHRAQVMVLTRLPLLVGPTDGERFNGRRGREWQRHRDE